ncbi:MAG: hypothetical protein WC481_07495 [Candidatus Omnitrophota bacterium]
MSEPEAVKDWHEIVRLNRLCGKAIGTLEGLLYHEISEEARGLIRLVLADLKGEDDATDTR